MFNIRDSEKASLPAAGDESSRTMPPPLYASRTLAHAPQSQLPGPEYKGREHHTVIDVRLTMRGELESDGDILVRGKVIGDIKCKVLIIDESAAIEGNVIAEEIVVRGAAKGKIRADRIRIEKTADVSCEICHKTFSAEEGARIRGALILEEETGGEEFLRAAEISAA